MTSPSPKGGMRYERGKDWVEISGAAERPMRDLVSLDSEPMPVAHRIALEVTNDAAFQDREGNPVDWREDVLALSVRQWKWWKEQIWAAARDEKLDPEA